MHNPDNKINEILYIDLIIFLDTAIWKYTLWISHMKILEILDPEVTEQPLLGVQPDLPPLA